ncbi:NTP transferase domain-containing protein [bacterium]|nr:NTP transferase domain-containing protein [bacterium]
MLLSAGLGTRMRPLTDHTPKPLIEIAGRTLIDRVLDKLVAQGVERAVVNVHHLAGQMEAHLARRADIEIIISDERDLLLETGGGVVKALPHLGSEPFFAINTDVAWETEGDDTFLRLARAFDPGRMDAVLLLADMTRTLGFHGAGDFFLDDEGRPVRRGDRARAPYVYAGAYVCTAGALAGETVHPFSANRYWDRFAAAGRLFATVMSPFWLHVGDPEARDKAERWLLDRAAGP